MLWTIVLIAVAVVTVLYVVDAHRRNRRGGDRYQALGEQIRFNASVPFKLVELAVLVVARHYTAQFEWYAHRKHATNAGLNPAIADAIAEGKRPTGMDADETAVYPGHMATTTLGAERASNPFLAALA